MSTAHGALILTVGVTLVVFAVAMARLFTRPSGVPTRMRVLAGAGAASGAIDLWALSAGRPSSLAGTLAGLACCVASLALFAGAERATRARRLSVAFSPDLPAHLTTGGPYARVRHPFYTAYALLWIGAALGAAGVVPWLVAAAMLALYVSAARMEEAKFAASPLGHEYAHYRSRAGMFWPRLFPPALVDAGHPNASPLTTNDR